jgi:acyl-CoA reductase-like NAD-dependent aldehyde dehydrogenase
MQNIFLRFTRLGAISALSSFMVLPAFASDEAASDDAATDMVEVQKEWAEAVDSLQDYSASQKDEVVAKTSNTLEQMDAQLEELEQQAKDDWNDLSTEARATRMQALGELRKQRDALAEWYQDLQGDSSRAWGEMKEGISDAYEDLQQGWQDALDEF